MPFSNFRRVWARITQVWADLERRMEAHIEDIQRAPDDWIPAIPIDDILNDCVDAAIVARLKLTGISGNVEHSYRFQIDII